MDLTREQYLKLGFVKIPYRNGAIVFNNNFKGNSISSNIFFPEEKKQNYLWESKPTDYQVTEFEETLKIEL